MDYNTWISSQNQNSLPTNRFVYVRQNTAFIANHDLTENRACKILINPNFKPTVHVNPKFTMPNCVAKSKPSIYVNPNVFKNSSVTTTASSSGLATSTFHTLHPKDIINDSFSKDRNNACASKTVIATRTKLIRLPTNAVSKIDSTRKSIAPKRNIVYSKYKIVRSDTTVGAKALDFHRSNKSHKSTSKFKVDNRLTNGVRISIAKKRFTDTSKKNNENPRKKNRFSFVKIDGVVFKSSRVALRRSSSFESKTKNPVKAKSKARKIINKNGVKYEVNVNKMTLKRVTDPQTRNVKISSKTPQKMRRLRMVLFAKRNFIKTRYIIRKLSTRPVHPSANKLKKCNIPCPIYRKFGRCRGKDRGTCQKIHDPAQIIICPKFLQGACVNQTCLLSHNVSSEKMPTCKFFLEGMCSKEDCPYLHVKVNPKADICQDFLQGYCKLGRECERRHQYLCPEFEKNGKCSKRKCTYPHGSVVRSDYKRIKLPIKHQDFKIETGEKVAKKDTDKMELAVPGRYYEEFMTNNKVEDVAASEIEPKRPKIGELPCFIPFADSFKLDGC